MGNTWSAGDGSDNRRPNPGHQHSSMTYGTPQTFISPPQQPMPPALEMATDSYLFATVPRYVQQYPNSNPNPRPPPPYQYGYYPPPPLPPFVHQQYGVHGVGSPNRVHQIRYQYGVHGSLPLPLPVPYVEHQKAVTIRNDVNIKKETLRIEPDEENPGKFLVTFTFDAAVAGSITLIFFAKEDQNCILTATKELLKPVTFTFKEGLGQKFRQPSGSGIDFSHFDEVELLKLGELNVYPIAIKAEASLANKDGSVDENQKEQATNSQITLAVFEKKDNGEYHVHVVKQILWVNGTRFELQEIYGIGNSVDNDVGENDSGKDCVICLSEPRDTTVLPCRHMCMCSPCAKLLRSQSNRCPICRQPVERLLEIKVNNRVEE